MPNFLKTTKKNISSNIRSSMCYKNISKQNIDDDPAKNIPAS